MYVFVLVLLDVCAFRCVCCLIVDLLDLVVCLLVLFGLRCGFAFLFCLFD